MLTLEERITRLERLLTNEIKLFRGRLKPEEMAADFINLCKSWNLDDTITVGNKVICSFDMKQFSRRIQKRMRYASLAKLLNGHECQLVCDTSKEDLTLIIKGKKIKVILDDVTHIAKEYKDRLLAAIGSAADQYFEKYTPDLTH